MEPSNILALIILICGIIGIIIIKAVGNLLKSRAKRTESVIDDIILSSIGKPLILFLIIITVYSTLATSTLIPPEYTWILDNRYLLVCITILVTWIFWSFVKNVANQYEEYILQSATNEAGIRFYHFFRSTFSYIVWIIAGIIILKILNVDITPLLAAGGIVGIAAGFAGKDILGNFFSGALLAADQPFRIGDRIQVQDYIGDVIAIGPRSTRIQTLDSQLITIPNSILTNDVVINYAEPDLKMKVRINIGVAYGSDIQKVKTILFRIADEIIKTGLCLGDPKPSVFFLEFAESSLNLQMIIWTEKYTMTYEIRDFINCRIQMEFQREGIEIPFPQMDVHMNK
ncbi:mechanosensitive ion channel domain-containing protein [Methanospirillum hungatei]|jgi:MscS family membrane protein|uniref:mechanosensitive ion channel family protein n=1 Tax=Methanospirillum hungatei TaxID=2203 RepID=UPI001B6D18B5|nr:mechanosensitive ion channel domain-containing protein [Methanospirillum hungatei]MBP7034523.1 mechanosensitive ion channel [Methanospirillum sp.]HOW03889.1 mechanosensitive ion channel [Methanospirillum hungatei]